MNILESLSDKLEKWKQKKYTLCHEQAHAIGNQAATKFMKNCFDVETKNTR